MEKNKLNKKNSGIVLFVCLLIVLLIFFPYTAFLNLFVPSVSYNDFSISFSKWGIDDSPNTAPVYRNNEGRIVVTFGLNIKSERDDLKYRIYYPGQEYISTGNRWYGARLNKGDNAVIIPSLTLANLFDKIGIEVCTNAKLNDFDKSSKGTLCKKEYFNPPKIDITLNPSSLNFERSKWETKDLYISVMNAGDVAVDFNLGLPDNNNYFGYCDLNLNPGESESCKITSGWAGGANLGTYNDIAYICALMENRADATCATAFFKKTFNLQTTVSDGA